MGKCKETPRYNVLSCRATDAELREILEVVGDGNRSAFVLEAVLEKIRRDRQRGDCEALLSGV